MKRSQCIDLILNWAKPEILQDVYNNNYEEWADNLLYTLETEYGILPPTFVLKQQIHENIEIVDIKGKVVTVGDFYTIGEVNEWETE